MPLQMDLSPNAVQWYVPGKVGATPSEDRMLAVAPQASFGSATPNALSPFRTNETDLIYVDRVLARIATGPDYNRLGLETLCKLSATWGVCDNVLYLGALPRVCRRGPSGTAWCPSALTCNVSFSATQHRGTCVDNVATLHFGNLRHAVACDSIVVANRAVPRVLSGGDVISLHQLQATFEYACDDSTLTVWDTVAPATDVGPLCTMAALILFLSVWQGWTSDMAQALATNNAARLAELWQTMAWFSLVVGDAVWFAAGSKVYYLYTESDSIMPEAVDMFIGRSAAYSYSWIYVVFSGLLAIVAMALLVVISVSVRVSPPAWAETCFGATLAHTTNITTRCVMLTILQWLVEVVALAAVHLASPPSLGTELRDALGLAIGVTIAVVTGRNGALIYPHANTLESQLLVLSAGGAVLVHVALFMLFPMYFKAEGSIRSAFALSATTAVQAASAGVFWSKRTGARATRARRTADQDQSPPIHF